MDLEIQDNGGTNAKVNLQADADLHHLDEAGKAEEESLTSRILETSRRKLQLIKELVTSEQYDSIVSELSHNLDSITTKDDSLNLINYESQRQDFARDEIVSGSRVETNGTKHKAPELHLQDNLTKKREAIEFFFREPTRLSSRDAALAIEVKSGYYLSSTEDEERRVIKQPSFSLADRFIGLLGFFGLTFDCWSATADPFVDHHMKVIHSPYARTNNLLTMKSRLQSDGQLDEVQRQLALDSSSRNPQQVKRQNLRNELSTITQVGYFNNIRLIRGIHFDRSDADLLCDHPYTRLLSREPKRRKLSTSMLDDNCSNLKLDLISLQITKHNLMSEEDKAALKVYDCARKLSELHRKFDRSTQYLIQALNHLRAKASDVDGDSKLLTKKLGDVRIKICSLLHNSEQELLAAAEHLDSVRREQGFNSTPVTVIKSRPPADRGRVLEILDLIIEWQRRNDTSDILDFFEQLRSDERALTKYQQTHDIEESNLDLTPMSKCPQEEVQRQKEAKRRLNSLQIKLLIGSEYFHKCHVKPTANLFALDLSYNQLRVPIKFHRVLNIQVEISERTMPLVNQPMAITELKLGTESSKRQTIEFRSSDQTIEARLELLSSVQRGSRKPSSRVKNEQVVKTLHSYVFTRQKPFETTYSMVSSLVNKVDSSFLILLLGEEVSRSYFSLDPFTVRCSSKTHETSNRYNLLTWRWCNNLNQPIYLSDRENIKILSLQSDERSVARPRVATRQDTGYKSIENVRQVAIKYIRHYEMQIEAILRSNEEESNNTDRFRMADLLVEPRLKMNLAGAARAARKLIPRRTVQRPLMPHRRAVKSLTKDLESTKTVESRTFAQWQRFVRQRASNLQLVVAVHQASNVPMRIVRQQQPQSQHLRPLTPQHTSASPISFLSQSSPPQPMSFGTYLMNPTTYVELVFQRNQQATSLAQGKSPSWNETLIFPVVAEEVARSMSGEDDESRPVHNQLVDECLQLNLYDYRSSLHESGDEGGFRSLAGELDSRQTASTWALLSEDYEPSVRESTAQRLVSSRQRVERHLLGSLCVPLTTLLTSGKIEGSFAIQQPLFLDDYQFEPEQPFRVTQAQLQGRTLTSETTQQVVTPQMGTCISLFITLDPPMSIPMHLYLKTGSFEEDRVFEYARLWERLVANWFQNRQVSWNTRRRPGREDSRKFNRHVRALVLQRDAKYCLICRLLGPLRPPTDLIADKTDKTEQMRAIARFVSLLRPLKYGVFNTRLLASSLWFDSAQLLEQSLGGPEEKAVLLCNFFLAMGHCSALLLGDAVPEGRCVYVIVWSEQSRFVHDQLQLQASHLLAASGANPSIATGATQQNSSINRDTFLSSLPILASGKSVQLWNADAGKAYSLADRLPLISVGSIVSVENVYANIQIVDSPSETNYDIRLKHFWFPLFEGTSSTNASTRGFRLQLDSNQAGWRRRLAQVQDLRRSIGRPSLGPILSASTSLDLERLGTDQCELLKALIENVIKAHLLKWRPERPTYFNRTLSRLLAEKLALFENYQESAVDERRVEWRYELGDLIKNQVLAAHLGNKPGSKQVISWPVNIPYTSMKAIVDSLYASGVHNADLLYSDSTASSTQFLVASHIHPYPSRVLSVWLYVAAIVTRPTQY